MFCPVSLVSMFNANVLSRFSSVASRLGCGYIKHPEQAQFQYTQDHGDTLTF